MTYVYYFTRSGTSEKIARKIAEKTGGRLLQIQDSKNWSGAFGFIKGALSAITQKRLPITYAEPEDNAEIFVCFPVWAGTFPPAVRVFINEMGRENVVLVPSSKQTVLKDRNGFKKIIDVIEDTNDVKID